MFLLAFYTETAERDGPRRNEFCPFDFFDGEIKFDYFLNEEKLCSGYESTLSQCSGSSFNIRFKGCSMASYSASYECIGHWHTLKKDYLAVIERINGTIIPNYKCGVSNKNIEHKNQTFIAFFYSDISI